MHIISFFHFPMIDRSTIDRIMASADIVDVVKDFVSLRKSGVNYKGLCPFHDDKTPSFMVSQTKQLCKCFSCGKGGNVVKFVMEIEQLSYPEALKWLGRKYGIEVREKELTQEEKAAAGERESMFLVNEWARDFFTQTLNDTVDGQAIGRSYFRRRGLRDDIVRKFQLGYSPESKDALAVAAHAKGFEDKYLEETGLCYRTSDGKILDRYHGRVIFPVHTISGRVVAFGGRSLLSGEEQKKRGVGKYVNSPESEIYHKKNELYGLFQAKKAIGKEDRVFLVEGYLDVISMHQSGVENVVASSGTSLTKEQVRLIHRFTENVTVLYDGDAAGIHAALRGVDMLLSEGLNIKVLLLPDGEDPDSFAQSHSPEELRKYIEEHQTDFIRFKADLLLKDAAGDPSRRASVIRDIVASIAVIPDDLTRDAYIHDFAGRMGIAEDTIVNEVVIHRKRVRDGIREEQERERMRAERIAGSAGTTPAGPQSAPQTNQQSGPGGAPSDVDPGFPPPDEFFAGPVSVSEEARFSSKSPAEKKANACERALIEMVIRYGGLPILVHQKKVEQKFYTGDNSEEEDSMPEYEVEENSPLVAPFIYQDLDNDGLAMRTPLFQNILIEAANLADEGNFDALNYFKMHENTEISFLAEELTDDRYLLSTSQSKMYTPDEYRLAEIVPRAINDYKHSLIGIEKESLLNELREPSVQENHNRVIAIMTRLQEINTLEVLFAKILGDRVIDK